MSKGLAITHIIFLFLSIIGFSYIGTTITDNGWIQVGIIIGGSLLVMFFVTITFKMIDPEEEIEKEQVEEDFYGGVENNTEETEYSPLTKEKIKTWADEAVPLLRKFGYLNETNPIDKPEGVSSFWKVLAIISIIMFILAIIGFGVFLYLLDEGRLADTIDLSCPENNITFPDIPSCPSMPSIPSCPQVSQEFYITITNSS